ncbi:type I polyketide synthase [Streptomyces sp. NBC_01451]|uniref:type I polyketide synthase n=1 Tax=Streptomyces sp. NBC_01451 TaxID=2903872 RepID=UPI002E37E385|nr:type I polyketide synthase [Streptomyces sp. NBC_01451]
MDNEERPCACLKRTTVETCEVRRRLTEAEKLESEPIVIVGMGCRFSGGIASPEDLWRVLEVGGNETMDFAVDRQWPVDLCDPEPGEPWASCTHRGGFLHDVSGFDPTVPGIGSREALTMDTRQRPLLLTFCEAFERAGIVPTSLRGSTTGDFLGIVCDYSSRLGGAPDEVVCYLSSRTANSGVSGHLSYLLGLQGPAITACSSSLVALHRAVLSLRRGESSRALAGGATVMQTTESLVQFSTQRGMSADSRCKAFAATADGTGFSEGAAVVVAERVSDALRHGHPVLALVRGSAVNQECAVNGMTAPNGMAQQRVIGEALRNAGLTAGQADMVGVQGTGTPLGDPIEAQALRAAYGRGRPAERPLLLGSLKSNVGLTQAPVDVADVIKSVSAIQRGTIPRTLHIDEPTPHADWSVSGVWPTTEAVPWPVTGSARRAGTSCFGMSGTNAYVVLEEAPATGEPVNATAPQRRGSAVPRLVSDRTREALRAQAASLVSHICARPGLEPLDVGYRLSTSPAIMESRGVAIGEETDGRLVGLRAPAHGGTARETAEALVPFTDWELSAVIRNEAGAPGRERTDVVQPALWAVMVSLAELWRSHGLESTAMVGHSRGEIAAACAAGALALEDGAKVEGLRSQANADELAVHAGMMAVSLLVGQALQRFSPRTGRLSLAVVNGSSSVEVSCDPEAMDELPVQLRADGNRHRRPVDCALHCAHVEGIRERPMKVLADVRPPSRGASRPPLVSRIGYL